MNKYIAALFWIVAIVILIFMVVWNYTETKISPLFYLYFAIFVTWGSIVELYYSFNAKKEVNKKVYYFLWSGVIFFPAALTLIYSYVSIEKINKEVEFWTLCGLIFFFFQLSANFLEKKSFKKE